MVNFLQRFKRLHYHALYRYVTFMQFNFLGQGTQGLITQEAAHLNNNVGLWVYYSNL